jgi:hypothetical protein
MDYGDHRLFLYDDIIELVVTSNSLYVDNRPMNHRRLQAHKGLTNTIIFNIRNRDRKLQNVFSDDIVAYIVNPATKRRLLSKKLDTTGDIGIVKLYLTEGDIQDIAPGTYRMYITRTTPDQNNMPVYTNQDNDVSFDIEISDEAVMDAAPTQSGTSLTQVSSNVFVSSAFSGNQDRNYQYAQHTVAIYPETYTGNIKIQASCVEGIPAIDDTSLDWFTISTTSLVNSSKILHETFVVNAAWVRVISYPDDANSSITQILLRN